MHAAQVREVEALDPHRQGVEPERPLQAVERLDALLAPALGLELLLVEREPRVALGEVEDAALAAALGGADLDRAAAPLGEDLLEESSSEPSAISPWTTISDGIESALA